MAENVQDTASAMGDISEHIESISREASESMAMLTDTVKMSNSAKEELERLSEASMETVNITSQVVKGIKESNESINEINRAIDMIMQIASQTDLLSLNASIEAARAGEAGRGFAVVAGEIKGLAEQSDASAKDIQEIIMQITKASEENTAYAGKIGEVVDNERAVLASVIAKFDSMNTNMENTMKSFDAIRNLISDLNQGKNKILDAIEQLSSISEENAASTQETNAAANELTMVLKQVLDKADDLIEIANALNSEMSKWKLS